MRATIKSIAQECNLSTTAVSLVLNERPNRISEKSKKLILETAKKQNYIPNQVAVGLVKGRTRTIGLILSDISNLFLAEVAKIVEEEVKKYNYTVLFGNTGDSGKRELEYIKDFMSKNVDGIILLHSSDATEKETEQISTVIENSSIPFVMMDNDLKDSDVFRSISDNVKGGYMATKYLLELGHRRIGSLLGPWGQCSVRDRFKGHKKALAEYKIDFNEELVYPGNFTIQSGIDAMPYFLKKDVTAIFSYNDMMSYGIYTYARENNIAIGKDISVISYDDCFINNILEVPLTSVKQPRIEMAKKATEGLMNLIDKKILDINPVIFDPELKIRNSVSSIIAT